MVDAASGADAGPQIETRATAGTGIEGTDVTCLTCGAELETTSTTCPDCGEPVAATVGAALVAADEPRAEADHTALGDAGDGPDDPWESGDESYRATPPSDGAPPGGYPPPGTGVPYGTPPPHPSGLSSEVRGWAIGAHLAGLIAGIATAATLGFVGALVVWLIKREDHPFIDHHGKEALNFQLTVVLAMVVGAILSIPTILLGVLTLGLAIAVGALVVVAASVLWVVLPIIGAVRASNGQAYHYPLTIRFVR